MNIVRNHTAAHIVALCSIVIIAGGLLYGTAYLLDTSRDGVIVSGVNIGSVKVGGLTKEQAYARVSESIARFESKGVAVRALTQAITLNSTKFAESTDATPIYEFDQDSAVNSAFLVGRGDSLWARVFTQWNAGHTGVTVELPVDTQDERIKAILARELAGVVTKPKETVLSVAGGSLVTIEPGVPGQMLMLDDAVLAIHNRLETLSFDEVLVKTAYKEPTISQAEAETLIPEFQKLVSMSVFQFSLASSTVAVARPEWLSWVTLQKVNGTVELTLDDDRVNATLTALAPQVETEAVSARFTIENGKVKAFAPARQGIAVDRGATITELKNQWHLPGSTVTPVARVSLIIKKTEPAITDGEVEKMGIKELVASGTTNFKGSPVNRRFNIKLGVEKISGSLVAPGDEFSTIKAIGEIDGEHGFKEELVIKGNETKPEFGGGLCQVSTTLFRSVMNAGLPVTARRNHSYRVSYYEPPVGKDATIYYPNPDFKWVNDTGHYVLILGRVEGDNATFELWGVKDGRTQIQTAPTVFNIVPPPPKKEIPVTTLAPGKIKCTERPHAGATAVFNYTITYPNGEVKDQEFRSVYRPWGEVCMVGVDPVAQPDDVVSVPPLIPQI